MRIAMVAACPFPSPQGSQVFVGQMCERLASRGHEIHLLTYGQGMQVVGRGFDHHQIRRMPGDDAMRSGPTTVKPVLDGLMVTTLDRLVRARGVEVLHCHNYEAALIGLAVRLRRGLPVVYHSHNLMGDELATYFQGAVTRALAHAAGRFLDSSVPRRVDHAIALCGYSAEVMRGYGVHDDRLSIIPPALDDLGDGGDRRAARARFDLNDEQFVVAYCGNLDGYQNLDTLLEAASLLSHGALGSRFVLLIATHTAAPEFEKLVAERGLDRGVRLLYVVDFAEARAAMDAADVLISPRQRGSGYPVKLLNYMSVGRPIVTAGCGSKFLTDGVDALVVADGAPAEIAAAVERLAADSNLAVRLAAAARSRFLSELTWDAVLPAIEEAYAKAAC